MLHDASSLSADIYNLKILDNKFEDMDGNTTRLVMDYESKFINYEKNKIILQHVYSG